jgi:F-type H+-transporting ATPase subunit c
MDLLNMLAATDVNWGLGFAAGLAAIGAGLGIIGAGFGISKIAASSVESMARQPEASGDIRNAMILTAALIEGVAFFGVYVCMSTSGGLVGQITALVAGGK